MDMKEIAALEDALKAQNAELKQFITKANEEIKIAGSTASETKNAIEAMSVKAKEIADRLMGVEQKIADKPGGGTPEYRGPGDILVESEEYKSAVARGAHSISPVKIGSFHKTAIINATGASQPLVPADRLAGLISPPLRRMTVRDLLPQGRTASNVVEFAKELLFTNAAGPQYAASPETFEGTTKPESAITFELASAVVRTLAHWIPVSRQVLADAPMLRDYVESRLQYGLKLEEEDQLLNGNNASGNLNGLIPQATAYNRGVTNDTKIDTIRKAMLQVQIADFEPTGIVTNPIDWAAIELAKDNDARYLWANPQSLGQPRLWGLPVVATNSMTAGDFLVGAFAMAAQIWDREDATVRVAEQHADFFVTNMVAILAEERLTLTVYRPLSFVKGSY